MAKVSLSRITPIKSVEDKTIEINGAEISIKQYIPVHVITNFITELMSFVFDNDGFISPIRHEIYFKLLIIKYFTNINLTEAMLENADKTFDIITLNNITDNIIDNIPTDYFNFLNKIIYETEKKVQEYNTSIVGLIKNSMDDRALTEINLNKTLEDIGNNNNFDTVREVLKNLS